MGILFLQGRQEGREEEGRTEAGESESRGERREERGGKGSGSQGQKPRKVKGRTEREMIPKPILALDIPAFTWKITC